MFKTKLFATICAVTSAVTVATTALTLSIAGPSGLQTIHSLSANDAVATGISNVFSSASNGSESITEFIDVLTSTKTAANLGFTINSIKGVEEVSGIGGELELQLDSEAEAAALLLNAKLGELGLFNSTLYVDKSEIIASVPFLFDGIISVGLDNLLEDLENSYIGSSLLATADIDVDELKELYNTFTSELATKAPDFDFDSDKFMDGLEDVISDAFDEAMAEMDTKDLGMIKLNGGSYQGYEAKVSVAKLSYIFRDSIKYILNSKDIQNLVDDVIAYAEETMGEDLVPENEFNGSMLGDLTSLVDMYWGPLVSELEAVLGENIQFTIYLTETVEIAGFEFDAYVINDKLTYNSSDASVADDAIVFKADYTGGKNIGDYTDISVEIFEENESLGSIKYVAKHEANGDFEISFNFSDATESYALTLNGNYVKDGDFFSLVVDSIKLIEGNETIADFGFTISFKPIDAVTKPSETPVYDLWEMDESDLMDLITNIGEKLEELGFSESSLDFSDDYIITDEDFDFDFED
ncbi:MAG: hypothetical protein UF228_09250 [Lachnospiraceae bacterium]|nr:hypothetical protein [Lachnospiraceae bacterium]